MRSPEVPDFMIVGFELSRTRQSARCRYFRLTRPITLDSTKFKQRQLETSHYCKSKQRLEGLLLFKVLVHNQTHPTTISLTKHLVYSKQTHSLGTLISKVVVIACWFTWFCISKNAWWNSQRCLIWSKHKKWCRLMLFRTLQCRATVGSRSTLCLRNARTDKMLV